jgi:putative ABC transport system ATP-binding protein
VFKFRLTATNRGRKLEQRSMDPILEARGLTKRYRMGELEVAALQGVDLEVQPGELVVLLGPSGSGKSTLLNILGGLDSPSSGTLRFGKPNSKIDLTAADDVSLTRYRRQEVGFVFQFYNLIPSLTARENVELITDIAAHPMPADEALELVGLSDRKDHFPSQLSGGQQQRVAIARAVAKRPTLLLCDEPTGALDFSTGRVVLEVLERTNRELGSATVVITHNAAIADMGDRVISFRDGRVAESRRNPARRPAAELSW